MNEADRREKTMLDLFDWITDFVSDRDDVTADDIRLAIAREFADGPRERDALLAQYRKRAWHAESQLETRYGLRKEINAELGLTDETGDEALRKGLETIKEIKAEAQKARKQMDELHACLKEAMEWCKPCNYEHEPWLRWAKARDSHKPNTSREER